MGFNKFKINNRKITNSTLLNMGEDLYKNLVSMGMINTVA